jgi:hypothetical protein
MHGPTGSDQNFQQTHRVGRATRTGNCYNKVFHDDFLMQVFRSLLLQ